MFPIYHLITREQGNPIRQDVRNSSFIGVAPTHLTRGPVARSIIILYIVMAQSASLFINLKYHRSLKTSSRNSEIARIYKCCIE